jgi:hypothetical protein
MIGSTKLHNRNSPTACVTARDRVAYGIVTLHLVLTFGCNNLLVAEVFSNDCERNAVTVDGHARRSRPLSAPLENLRRGQIGTPQSFDPATPLPDVSHTISADVKVRWTLSWSCDGGSNFLATIALRLSRRSRKLNSTARERAFDPEGLRVDETVRIMQVAHVGHAVWMIERLTYTMLTWLSR